MDLKTSVICGCALFAAIIDLALTDDNKIGSDLTHEEASKIQKRMATMAEDEDPSPYLTEDDVNELIKRGSLLRFGKRGSLFRFGKRGSLFRFGKRRSLFRYGKRFDAQDDSDSDLSQALPLDAYTGSDNEAEKRGSLFRFGKRPALFRYGRSVDSPHTPFRFGREEEYES